MRSESKDLRLLLLFLSITTAGQINYFFIGVMSVTGKSQ